MCKLKNLPIKLLKTLHTFSKKYLHPSSHPNAQQTLGSKCPGNRLFGNPRVLMPCEGEAAKHSIGTCMKRKKCRWWKSPILCWLLPQGSEVREAMAFCLLLRFSAALTEFLNVTVAGRRLPPPPIYKMSGYHAVTACSSGSEVTV